MTGNILAVDTETTGFIKKGAKIQEGQARVCQLAMLQVDAKGNAITQFSCLIRPDGAWTVSEGAAAVHGFSTEKCQAEGLFLGDVLKIYSQMVKTSSVIIAHNVEFDRGMMEIEEAHTVSIPPPRPRANGSAPWKKPARS